MRSRWNLPIYLVYIVLCALVLGIIVKGIGVTAPWQHPREVTAVFRSGDGILANNEVFLNGVKVGKVESVDVVGGRARVVMAIEDANAGDLYRDAGAEVRKKNLLGETYIDLHRGSQKGQLLNGDITNTLSPVDIDEVLAILDPQSRERLQVLINGAGDALTGQGGNINDSTGTFRQLTTELNGPATLLAARQQQIDSIVLELQALYDMLAKQRDQVRDEIGTWSTVMGQLAAQDQSIAGTLQQADTFLQSTDTLLTGTVPALRQTLAALPSTLLSTQAWLTQSNDIFSGIAPFRRSIHDVFNDLNTTFKDFDPSNKDPEGNPQHLWSVYSVSCSQNCTNSGTSPASASAPTAPNPVWASAMGGG